MKIRVVHEAAKELCIGARDVLVVRGWNCHGSSPLPKKVYSHCLTLTVMDGWIYRCLPFDAWQQTAIETESGQPWAAGISDSNPSHVVRTYPGRMVGVRRR